MSNKLPLFASAPLCTIEVDSAKIAYAVGLSLNVGISLQEIRVLGQFELESIEPMAMMPVTGSFQVIRLLTEAVRKENVSAATKMPNSLVRTKEEVGDLKGLAKDAVIANSTTSEQGTGALTGSSELAKHLDPRTILLSKSFDITIKMKVPSVKKDKDWVQGDETVFMEIKDCRLSGASASISPGALLTESVEFQGLIAIRKKAGKPVEASSVKVNDL
ncbi:MAG: hypothetical protein EBU90_22910 [Proteobacteria bacterium]|nr:hypothetical protein [Pseudomonadota bacterium]